MIFFITHQIIQNLIPWNKDTKDSKKNITTFLIGAVLYVFLLSFVNSTSYSHIVNSVFFLYTLKNWLLWILAIDVTAMAVVYKCYYKRSIIEELPETLGEKKKTDSRSVQVEESPGTEEEIAELFMQHEAEQEMIASKRKRDEERSAEKADQKTSSSSNRDEEKPGTRTINDNVSKDEHEHEHEHDDKSVPVTGESD